MIFYYYEFFYMFIFIKINKTTMLKNLVNLPKTLIIEIISFLEGKEIIKINDEVKDEFFNNLMENTFWIHKILKYDDIVGSIKNKKLYQFGIIDLYNTKITDNIMEYLGKLTKPWFIDLASTVIMNNNMKYLEKLTSLQVLNLRGTKITGDNIKYLENLTNLLCLDLCGAKIEDLA